ncbi:MAG TPA: hypothetical protein VIF09_15600 [Polyangiaceae bacterium]
MDPVGLARVAACAALLGASLSAHHVARAAPGDPPSVRVVLWADRDDDDADGHPDGEQRALPPVTHGDLVPIDKRFLGAVMHVVSGGEHARIVLGQDGPMPWGRAVPEPGWFQGLSAGRVEILAKTTGGPVRLTLEVRGLDMRDGAGQLVDSTTSHASLERTPPVRVEGPADAPYDDPDALRVVLSLPDDGPGLDGDREIAVEAVNALGARVDVLPRLPLASSSCVRPAQGLRCWASAPLRLVIDDIDRNHPLVAERSIKAEVGGAIVFRDGGRKAQMIRVLGPRASPVGPIGRLRATLRPFVVRISPGGAPAIGGSDVGAVNALRAEVGSASAIWGQCGLTFGDARTLDVKVVDPPPPHLVALGDDLGVGASGGVVRLRAEGKSFALSTTPGESIDRVASELARAVEHAGLVALVSPNARIGPGLGSSVDVSVRRKDGSLVAVDLVPDTPLSTDPTLSVRIGSVDLSDGLQHFTDMDAMAGTLEERTLLKAVDDGDPTTTEVVVVPLFAGGGRIGESFIGSDLSSVRNVVLLDRAGIRARKSSLTLAHELGHVLMDLPGHPDDYGVDTPTLLMDSDAADASPFGPRRLSIEECARVVRQSGPKSRVPLLADAPIGPLPLENRR